MTTLEIVLIIILYIVMGVVTGIKIANTTGSLKESASLFLWGSILWPITWIIRIIQTVFVDTWDW